MAGKVVWHGDKVRAAIQAEVGKRLRLCGQLGVTHAKELVSVDGTARTGGGSLAYGANPSKPGDPPHVQTGRLRASIAYEVSGLVARIGTNVKYGRYLELGTSRMLPRPWLRRMLREKSSQFRAILGSPIRTKGNR